MALELVIFAVISISENTLLGPWQISDRSIFYSATIVIADANIKINKLLGVELQLFATRLVTVLGFKAVCDTGLRLGEFVGSYNGIRKTM